MFTIGKVYNRRNDLHKKFGGNVQSGISPSKDFPIIFIFTSPNGKVHGYKDAWISSNTFQYTGEGQFGDMELTRGNLAIKNHKAKGKHIHLFERVEIGEYKYVGELSYLKHEVINGEDTENLKRRMIVFTLQKI